MPDAMVMNRKRKTRPDQDRNLYLRQNKVIHQARSQLDMSLDDCRKLAKQIGKKASLSCLSLRQRWELIEALKARGAEVYNPPLLNSSIEKQKKPEDAYFENLAYWNKRFSKHRQGFASNKQLAWIQTLWELDFDDGRTGCRKGLRGFIFRQTKSLKNGPVSDLAFLRAGHVAAVIGPLKAKAEQRLAAKTNHCQ